MFCTVCIVWVFIAACNGLYIRTKSTPLVENKTAHSVRATSIILRFKSGNANEDEDGFLGSMWKGIKRFMPKTSRSRLIETYKTPLEDTGNRYEVRLVNVNQAKKRHTITRLRRYLPDLSWETAEGMVDLAIDEGAALIRVLNSQNEVEYLVDMLHKADPPVTVEVYDNKKQETVVL